MQLSTSALNVFADCKRCFYLDRKMKAARPRGIFPSLPGGVDGILKSRLTAFRGQLPPALNVPELGGWTLFKDADKLEKYRQWNSKGALKYTDDAGNVLVGGLDDILQNSAGDLVAPLDYKTKGAEREDAAGCPAYYQRQLDVYALLLSTEYDVADFGVLFDFWPVECKSGLVKFECKPTIADVSAARGKALFEEALALLESTELPDADPKCEYCRTFSGRSEAMKKCLIG